MPEENKSVPGLYTERKAIAFLESIGYRVFPEEKVLVRRNHSAAERYSLGFLREHLSYDDMLQQMPYGKDIIDTFFHYLHDAVNSTKGTLRVNGENMPRSVVISVLLKLKCPDFLYAVAKYQETTTKINNHGAYILTLLYNARAQNEADLTNRVQHDLYGLKE